MSWRLAAIGLALVLIAAEEPRAQSKDAATGASSTGQSIDPLDLQRARAAGLKQRAGRVYYTKKFDLSTLPEYKPTQTMSGTIRQWGSNYLADSMLEKSLEDGFHKYHPDVKFENNLGSTFIGIAGLYARRAALAPMGRRATWDELQGYQRVFNTLPVEIAMATGSYDVAGWTFALVVFVNKDNPIAQLTFEQLDGIFGAERDGGWNGNEWDPSAARGPDKNIRTWGQLGLKGDRFGGRQVPRMEGLQTHRNSVDGRLAEGQPYRHHRLELETHAPSFDETAISSVECRLSVCNRHSGKI